MPRKSSTRGGFESPTTRRKKSKGSKKKGKKGSSALPSDDDDESFYSSPKVSRKPSSKNSLSPSSGDDGGGGESGELSSASGETASSGNPRASPSRPQPSLPPSSSPSSARVVDEDEDEDEDDHGSSPFNFDFTKQAGNLLAARELLGSKTDDDGESEEEEEEDEDEDALSDGHTSGGKDDDSSLMDAELADELGTDFVSPATSSSLPSSMIPDDRGAVDSDDEDDDTVVGSPLPPPRTESEGYVEVTSEDRAGARSALGSISSIRPPSPSPSSPSSSGGGGGGGGSVASKWEAARKREERERSGSVNVQAASWRGSGSVSKMKERWAASTTPSSADAPPPSSSSSATYSRGTGNVVKEKAALFLASDRGARRGRGGMAGRGGRGKGAPPPSRLGIVVGKDVGQAKAMFENRSSSSGATTVQRRKPTPVVSAIDSKRKKDLEAMFGGKPAAPPQGPVPRGAKQPKSSRRKSGGGAGLSNSQRMPRHSSMEKPSNAASKMDGTRSSSKSTSKLEKLAGERIGSSTAGSSSPTTKKSASKDFSLEYSVDDDTDQLVVVGGHPPGLLQRCLDDPKKNFDQDLYIQTFLLTHPLFYPSCDLLVDLFDLWYEDEMTSGKDVKKKDSHKLTKTQIRILTFCHKWVFEFNTQFIMSPELRKQFVEKVEALKEARVSASGKSKKKAKKFLKEIELFDVMVSHMGELTGIQAKVMKMIVQTTRDKTTIDKDAMNNVDFDPAEYVSKVVSTHSAQDLARQLTLAQFMVFRRIFPREFYKSAWMKNKSTAPNAVHIIQTFNNVSYWMQNQIVCLPEQKQRVKVISKFISMGKEMLALNNFNGVMLVLSALNNSSVQRLRDDWKALSTKSLRAYNSLQDIFNPEGNFRVYREMLANVSPPCIPFMGIFLNGITYIDENDNNRNGRLNFSKMMILGKALLELRRYQSEAPQIKPIPSLLTFFLGRAPKDKKGYPQMKWVTEKPIKAQSMRIKPRPGATPAPAAESGDSSEATANAGESAKLNVPKGKKKSGDSKRKNSSRDQSKVTAPTELSAAEIEEYKEKARKAYLLQQAEEARQAEGGS